MLILLTINVVFGFGLLAIYAAVRQVSARVASLENGHQDGDEPDDWLRSLRE